MLENKYVPVSPGREIEKTAPIMDEFDELGKAIAELRGVIASVEKQLSPVLLPEYDATVDAPQNIPSGCGVRVSIVTATRDIRDTFRLLLYISKRIDL